MVTFVIILPVCMHCMDGWSVPGANVRAFQQLEGKGCEFNHDIPDIPHYLLGDPSSRSSTQQNSATAQQRRPEGSLWSSGSGLLSISRPALNSQPNSLIASQPSSRAGIVPGTPPAAASPASSATMSSTSAPPTPQRLPVGAPVFVPASIAQRVVLSAWSAKPTGAAASNANSNSTFVDGNNTASSGSSTTLTNVHAPPFVPGSAQSNISMAAAMKAAPFVPSLSTVASAPAFIPQSRNALGNNQNSQAYKPVHDSPTMGPYRLPEGDDPALGMVSPPTSAAYAVPQPPEMSLGGLSLDGNVGRQSSGNANIMAQLQARMMSGAAQQPMGQSDMRAVSPPTASARSNSFDSSWQLGFQQQQQQQQRQVAQVAATTRGGATYFFGPGQGVSGPSIAAMQSMPFTQGYASAAPAGLPDLRSKMARGLQLPGHSQLSARFMAESLQQELRTRTALVQAQLDPERDSIDLPDMLHKYHTLYPLEDMASNEDAPSAVLGIRTTHVKGISSTDGAAYALVRIDSRQVVPSPELLAAAKDVVDRWSQMVGHPHICPPLEAFVSRDMEDSAALFLSYEYHPGAVTLQKVHLAHDQAGASGIVHVSVSEDELWSYAVQLATALRATHAKGLTFRSASLHPSKVLLTSRGRLRIGTVGLANILHGDPTEDPRILQIEDLVSIGRLLLALACGSTSNASLEFVAAHYSPELQRLISSLLMSGAPGPEGSDIRTARQLCARLGERAFDEVEQAATHADRLLSELALESENGRLFRLLVKLGTINERPDGDAGEAGWSETGDRYLLKLFRDFVFHQTAEDGSPVIDWGHVIECLNKLDAGVAEKILLMSRDERSMLVVSYRNLKKCVEGAYAELMAKGLATSHAARRRPSLSMQ
eukprot:jgi/Chlat1/6018/Chrsp4S06201